MPTQTDTFNELRRTNFITVLKEIQDMSFELRSNYYPGNKEKLWKQNRKEIIEKHNWTVRNFNTELKRRS